MSENNSPKFVKKKRVTVRCTRPFRIGLTPFSGYCPSIVLSVEEIATIIQTKSFVVENLTTGETVPLNFSNYNTYNGPTDVDDDTPSMTDVKNRVIQPIKKYTADGKEIIPEAKRKIGGGIRKDPRVTGQIPVVNKEVTVETKKEEKKEEVKTMENSQLNISMNIKKQEQKQQEQKQQPVEKKVESVKESEKKAVQQTSNQNTKK